ncbi:unnamed protein product [Rhizopus stolonifer]
MTKHFDTRHCLLHAPVTQLPDKDRYLFLFSDLLIICKPTQNLFKVKQILELSQITLKDTKIHPILLTAFRKFNTKAPQAIGYLIQKRVLTQDPLCIARFLYKTPLNRRQLALYLSQQTEIYDCFLDCFRLAHLTLDQALRQLLTMLCLPERWTSLEPLLVRFSKKWHDANQNVVGFDGDRVLKVVMATLFLNSEVWFGFGDLFGLARGIQARPSKPLLETFLERWNEYDGYHLVPREFMTAIYRSVLKERLETVQGEEESALLDISGLPSRLALGYASEEVTVKIAVPDPGLQIKLGGSDLVFEPSLLDFSASSQQSFKIIGQSLGKKSFGMTMAGSNGGSYQCPFRHMSVWVDRGKQYTLDLTDLNHRYTFSLENQEEYLQWMETLKTHCRPTPKGLEYQIALRVLREGLFEKHLDQTTIIKQVVHNSRIPLVLGFLQSCLKDL